MFDSGFGGLTVARAVIDLLPAEHIVYVGDTGRYPYGPQSQASVAGPAPVLPGNPAPLSASRIAAFLSGEQEAVPAPMVTLRETVPTIGPDGPVPASNPGDASDQLHAALDELRRSLRRG